MPPLYDYDVGWRLTPESLNERKACTDVLRWTKANPVLQATESFSPPNYWVYGDTGTNTIAGRQAWASSIWPTNYLTGPWYADVALINVEESPPAVAARVRMMARPRFLAATTLNTNYSKSCQLYLETSVAKYATVSTNNVYYTWGLPFAEDRFVYLYETNLPAGPDSATLTNEMSFYTTAIGTNLPWEVIGTTPLSALGFNVNAATWLIRWDGTNGFRYK
jgi:hypothetical protein